MLGPSLSWFVYLCHVLCRMLTIRYCRTLNEVNYITCFWLFGFFRSILYSPITITWLSPPDRVSTLIQCLFLINASELSCKGTGVRHYQSISYSFACKLEINSVFLGWHIHDNHSALLSHDDTISYTCGKDIRMYLKAWTTIFGGVFGWYINNPGSPGYPQ